MKRFEVYFVLFFCILLGPVVANSQQSLQRKIAGLKTGETDLAKIRQVFGEPDSRRVLTEWVAAGDRNPNMYYIAGGQPAKNRAGAVRRTLACIKYEKPGLRFCLFDNPSELYSIESSLRNLSRRGVRVGDTLHKVRRSFGKNGSWWTASKKEGYALEFKKMGIRFTFETSPNRPRYPTKLEMRRRVKAIEIFDKRVFFGG